MEQRRILGKGDRGNAMELRLRLLMGATALVYIGPLLAGIADHSWLMVPVYTAVFILWLFIMRPHEWPREPDAWTRPQTWIAASAHIAVQLLLVACCFAIGRGMAGVAGLTIHIPPMVPLIISFMGIPVSRLIWDPSDRTRFGGMVEEALQKVGMPKLFADAGDMVTADTQTAIFANMTDHTPQETIERHLAQIGNHVHPKAVMQSLMARAKPASASLAVRRALVLWATDPVAARQAHPLPAPAAAFRAARGDRGLMTLFAPRAIALLKAHADLWPGFPGTTEIYSASGEYPDLAGPLIELAERLEKIAPRNPLE